MEKFVQVEKVGMSFDTKKGKFTALTGIDLHVDQGEFIEMSIGNLSLNAISAFLLTVLVHARF